MLACQLAFTTTEARVQVEKLLTIHDQVHGVNSVMIVDDLCFSLAPSNDIRHLPVVRDGRLTGLVTHRDLLAASFSIFAEIERNEQRRIFDTVRVVEAMHRDVVTVSPDLGVAKAASILLENKYGCLPVVDDKSTLLGIVTEADFLRLTVRLLK